MTRRDVLKLAWANLQRMRARVALTAIGVIIGTAAVIILISLGVGLQTSAEATIGGQGDLTVIQIEGSRGGGDGRMGRGQMDEGGTRVFDDEAIEEIRELEHVTTVTPLVRVNMGASYELSRDWRSSARTRGIAPESIEQMGWDFSEGDGQLQSGNVILGKGVFDEEDEFFGSMGPGGPRGFEPQGPQSGRGRTARERPPLPDSFLGRSVTLRLVKWDPESGQDISRKEKLRIAGILSSENESSSAYISLEQADEINRWNSGERRNPRDGYPEGMVKVDKRKNVKAVQDTLKEMDFQTRSLQEILSSLNLVFIIIQAVLGGVGAVALLVAAFGIANTMTMAIYERTREIGIMKAIGATNRDVLQVFLTEAAAIGLFGGVLGTAVGWFLGFITELLLHEFIRSQSPASSGEAMPDVVVTPLWLMSFAVVFAVVIGLVSGVYPAMRAANLKPLQALRTD